MDILAREIGGLPAGLWLVGALLVWGALGFVTQAISVFSWKTALRLKLQEDDPESDDPLERALVPVEWGVALADVFVQGPALILAFWGLYARHWIGLAGATAMFVVLVYAGLFYPLQRYGIKFWGIGDWRRWRRLALAFFFMAALPSLIGLVALWSNWRYFTTAP